MPFSARAPRFFGLVPSPCRRRRSPQVWTHGCRSRSGCFVHRYHFAHRFRALLQVSGDPSVGSTGLCALVGPLFVFFARRRRTVSPGLCAKSATRARRFACERKPAAAATSVRCSRVQALCSADKAAHSHSEPFVSDILGSLVSSFQCGESGLVLLVRSWRCLRISPSGGRTSGRTSGRISGFGSS